MSRQKVGVIGCGAWGKNLVRVFHELGALAAVCDENPARLESLRKSYPRIQIHQKAPELIENPAVSAVAVAAPSPLHFPLASQALLAGKHLFVEKPLALSYAQGLELVQLAERQKKILMVGHILEYHPAVAALQKILASGELGKLFYIYSSRLNLGRVRQEENILWSFAPHDLSVILRLLGEMPLWVSCAGGSYLTPNIADVTLTSLVFPSGIRGHLFVSWLHPYKEQKLIVVGSNKMAVFDDTAPDKKLKLLDRRIDWKDGKPLAARGKEEAVAFESAEPLRLELKHFLDCLDSGQSPLTSGKKALDVLEILEAGQHSLSLGGNPVAVEEHASALSGTSS